MGKRPVVQMGSTVVFGAAHLPYVKMECANHPRLLTSITTTDDKDTFVARFYYNQPNPSKEKIDAVQ